MTALTRTLFGRSDLELILSSPANAHSLFAVRAFSIAVDSVASVGLLLATLAYVAALWDHPHWLAPFPAPIAAVMVGTGLGSFSPRERVSLTGLEASATANSTSRP
jgi:ABC-2 type transport system permease protein